MTYIPTVTDTTPAGRTASWIDQADLRREAASADFVVETQGSIEGSEPGEIVLWQTADGAALYAFVRVNFYGGWVVAVDSLEETDTLEDLLADLLTLMVRLYETPHADQAGVENDAVRVRRALEARLEEATTGTLETFRA